jgi:hypothetical protein
LARVCRVRAVVFHVPESIAIAIRRVAGVAPTVAVRINLISIGNVLAVIGAVQPAIIVNVSV